MRNYDESLAAYKAGLVLEPNNEALQSGVAQVEQKVKVCKKFGGHFE